jgi:hypothetical protein
MPITTSILEHDVLGPLFLKGVEEGRREALEDGYRKGMRRGLRVIIEKRFGALPTWAIEKLEALSTSELESLVGRC